MSNNKKLGLEPAFTGAEGYRDFNRNGMSKRLYIAAAAMQGLCASNMVQTGTFNFSNPEKIQSITKLAYIFADELLKQELEGIDE